MPERYSVFASVGNATQPFNRFIELVDAAAGQTGMPTLIQTGRGQLRPAHADAVPFVVREHFDRLVKEADFVITHCGVGSVISAVSSGKIPLVMVRRKDFGEHVNDHQEELAAELSRSGLIRIFDRLDELVKRLSLGPERIVSEPDISNETMLAIMTSFLAGGTAANVEGPVVTRTANSRR